MQNHKHIQFYFFLALLALVLALNITLFLPFIKLFAIVTIFAVILSPLYDRIVAIMKNHNLAAFATVVLAAIIVLVPTSFFVSRIFLEASSLSLNIESINHTLAVLSADLNAKLGNAIPSFSFDLSSYAGAIFRSLTTGASSIIGTLLRFIPFLLLGFVSLFFFLRDGKRFIELLVRVSPLSDNHNRTIIEKERKAINAVVKGSLLIAALQGFLTWVGFLIFGIPNPALWGGVAVLAALIPGVGTALVIVPSVIYLFSVDATGASIGLAIWGGVIVGLVDNLVRPILVGKDVNIHPFLILMSVFGGLIVFGPLGFLLGPLVLSLLYALVDIYPAIKKDFLG